MDVMNVGVLVSGRGSNLGALIEDASQAGAPYRIAAVVSNRLGVPALRRAAEADVAATVIERGAYADRHAQQRAIVEVLREHDCQLVVAAGFDQILHETVIQAFPQRILNIHPSLLPAFAGGLHAQADALECGVKIAGCTVHIVTAEVDGGPIVDQVAVPVLDTDTAERLAARILEQEHQMLPAAVRLFAEGRVRVEGRRVFID